MIMTTSPDSTLVSNQTGSVADNGVVVSGSLMDALRQNPVLPALGQSVMQVLRIASDDDHAVQDLARFVMSDVALTQKILTLANSANYRTLSRSPITSVSRAIYLIGFDAVKTLALATLIVDGLAGVSAGLARRELLVSVTASLAAQELVRRKRRTDTESLPVVALFMNLGRLLVAVHDAKAYQQIDTLAQKIGEAEAVRLVLGCSLTVITVSVLKNWQIPNVIVAAMLPPSPAMLRAPQNEQEWLQVGGQFCAEISNLILEGNLDDPSTSARQLLQRYGDGLQLDLGTISDMLSMVQRETRFLMQVTSAPKPLVPSIEDDMAGLTDCVLTVDVEPDAQETQYFPSGKPYQAQGLLLEGLEEFTEAVSLGTSNATDLMRLALSVLQRALGLRFVVLCLGGAGGQYQPLVALNDVGGARKSLFVWPQVMADDLFHLALSHQVDMAIADAGLDNVIKRLPGYYRSMVGDAKSFLLLPLIQGKRSVGLIYGDRRLPAPEGVTREEVLLIRAIKSQMMAVLGTQAQH